MMNDPGASRLNTGPTSFRSTEAVRSVQRPHVALVGCVLTLGIAGCSASGISPSSMPTATLNQPSPDSILQYTNRWIENPSIDLMSPEGTFVRAAMESLDRVGVGAVSGEEAIADAGYPGFLHAFNAVRDPEEWVGNRGPINDQVGTRYWEVVELRREGDFFRTGVCSYGSAIAVKTQDGYRSSGSKPIGSATWITFGQDPALAPDKQAVPPSSQRGPERAPVLDVFGSWVLTDLNVLDAAKDLPQCMSTLAPGTPSDAPKDYVVQAEPPPTLPPSPGWPDA